MGSPPLGRDFRAVPPPVAATRGGVRMTRLRKLSRRIVLADHRSKLTVYFQSLHNSDIYRKFQGGGTPMALRQETLGRNRGYGDCRRENAVSLVLAGRLRNRSTAFSLARPRPAVPRTARFPPMPAIGGRSSAVPPGSSLLAATLRSAAAGSSATPQSYLDARGCSQEVVLGFLVP